MAEQLCSNTTQLIWTFNFAYTKSRFSYDAAHMNVIIGHPACSATETSYCKLIFFISPEDQGFFCREIYSDILLM